jgi:hypothetical protein
LAVCNEERKHTKGRREDGDWDKKWLFVTKRGNTRRDEVRMETGIRGGSL